jgi:hypothetical protein
MIGARILRNLPGGGTTIAVLAKTTHRSLDNPDALFVAPCISAALRPAPLPALVHHSHL